MARYSDTLRDDLTQAPISGAHVSVIDYAGAYATLTNDDTSPLANPFITNEYGAVVFNTAPGRYTLQYRYGSRLVSEARDVVVGDLIAAINPSPANAGKFIALDASGNPTYSTGTGADAGLRTDLAASNGGALIGMPGGKTLALAALLSPLGGLALIGQGASMVRPEGQLYLANQVSSPGHTIATLDNLIATEEAALEFVGRLSNGAIQQMCAQFVRWVNSNNNPANFNVVWAIHGVGGPGQDNTSLEVWFGSNSVRVCRGDTSNMSWNFPIPNNMFEVYTSQRIGSSLMIGPNHGYANSIGFGLEVEGFAAIGTASGGGMSNMIQLGYSVGGSTGFIQVIDGFGTMLKLAINGSEITLGAAGQKLGLLGATAIARPSATGSRGGNAALASLLTALANLGAVTDSTTA